LQHGGHSLPAHGLEAPSISLLWVIGIHNRIKPSIVRVNQPDKEKPFVAEAVYAQRIVKKDDTSLSGAADLRS
jgi:hypothetical protein